MLNQTISARDVVQIQDEKTRSQWKLAVVEELITERDGFTRVAKIRTKKWCYIQSRCETLSVRSDLKVIISIQFPGNNIFISEY
jgi:hypothetical protein